jgi:hypothetical protein
MKIVRILSVLLIPAGLWWQAALAAAPPANPPGPPQAAAAPAPVLFRGQTLFHLKTWIGAFSPEARAQAIVDRLERVASSPFRAIPALQAVNQEQSIDIDCGDTILMTVTEADARAEGVPRDLLGRQRLEALQAVLQAQSWRTRLKGLARVLAWALVITGAGLAVAVGLRKATGRLRRGILAVPENRFLHLRIQNLELVSASRMRQLLVRLPGWPSLPWDPCGTWARRSWATCPACSRWR